MTGSRFRVLGWRLRGSVQGFILKLASQTGTNMKLHTGTFAGMKSG